MSERILLDDTGLRISKPGVNVTSASNDDLIFSSDWSQLAIFMRGSSTVGDHNDKTINFGRTFTNIPLVCVQYHSTFMISGGASFVSDDGGVTGHWDFTLITSTDNFKVTTQGGSGIDFDYVVWDFDL